MGRGRAMPCHVARPRAAPARVHARLAWLQRAGRGLRLGHVPGGARWSLAAAATSHARDLGRERDGRRRGLVLGVGVGGGRRRVCSAVAEHGCEWRLLMREAQRLTHL